MNKGLKRPWSRLRSRASLSRNRKVEASVNGLETQRKLMDHSLRRCSPLPEQQTGPTWEDDSLRWCWPQRATSWQFVGLGTRRTSRSRPVHTTWQGDCNGFEHSHLSTTLLTYLRSWALLEEPPILQLLKNFPAFYGTRRFNTVFTRALH
jgi:hypothetical protein